MKNKFLTLTFFCLFVLQGISQVEFSDIITQQLNNYLISNLQEKVFVETNLEQFDIGDTIWFKATITDALKHLPAVDEKMFYIDFVSPENKVVYHQVYKVFSGFAGGYLPIKPDFTYGSYKLIAYTNFMKNFSKDYFFQKEIEIQKKTKEEYQWEFTTKVNEQENGDSVQVSFMVQSSKNSTINANANLKIQLGKGTIWGAEARIINNIGHFSTFIPDSLGTPQAILAISAPFLNGQNEKVKIELSASKPDIKFTPEGGQLLPNISNIVAVKSLNEKGSPLVLSGKVYNEKNEFITSFETKVNGMGAFSLFPNDSSKYYAEINWKNEKFTYELPEVNKNGYSIRLVAENADSLQLLVVKPNTKKEFLSIMGHTRGLKRFFVSGSIQNREIILSVPKKNFYTGITVFYIIC